MESDLRHVRARKSLRHDLTNSPGDNSNTSTWNSVSTLEELAEILQSQSFAVFRLEASSAGIVRNAMAFTGRVCREHREGWLSQGRPRGPQTELLDDTPLILVESNIMRTQLRWYMRRVV